MCPSCIKKKHTTWVALCWIQSNASCCYSTQMGLWDHHWLEDWSILEGDGDGEADWDNPVSARVLLTLMSSSWLCWGCGITTGWRIGALLRVMLSLEAVWENPGWVSLGRGSWSLGAGWKQPEKIYLCCWCVQNLSEDTFPDYWCTLSANFTTLWDTLGNATLTPNAIRVLLQRNTIPLMLRSASIFHLGGFWFWK